MNVESGSKHWPLKIITIPSVSFSGKTRPAYHIETAVSRRVIVDDKALCNDIVTAVNNYSSLQTELSETRQGLEELVRKLNDARKTISELTAEWGYHKKPSGKYCDKCHQVWPCGTVRGHYEEKAIDVFLAKAKEERQHDR